MTDNELLLAISNMLDVKLSSELQPIKNEIGGMKSEIGGIKSEIGGIKSEIGGIKSEIGSMKSEIHNIKLFQENVIMPRLETIESCYTTTYDRYKNYADKMESAFQDIDIMKKVISEHSELLKKIS